MIEHQPSYVLVADAPPLRDGGYGCCVLAWNWLQAMGASVRRVVTRRFMPQLELSAVAEGSPAPVVFYPDLARFRGATRLGWLNPVIFGCFALGAIVPLIASIT